jgi:hypothetical protein
MADSWLSLAQVERDRVAADVDAVRRRMVIDDDRRAARDAGRDGLAYATAAIAP